LREVIGTGEAGNASSEDSDVSGLRG